MASGIPGPPNEYKFGLDFDYTVWVPGTQIDLVSVPWDNNYKDVVVFDTAAEFDTYINGLNPAGIRLDKLSYVKPNRPVRIPIPHNRAIKYNYLRVTNPLQPVDGDVQKTYYYFILDYNYINPQTTEVVVQLDVWSTYIYGVEFGSAFVTRGHASIANSKSFDNNGRDYLSIPEGLDIGSEYQTVEHVNKTILQVASPAEHDVLAVSTIDLLMPDFGTVDDPNMDSSPGSVMQMMPSGAGFYLWNSATDFNNFMTLNKMRPWITQGIVAVMMIPPLNRYHPGMPAIPDGPVPVRVGAANMPTPSGPPQAIEHELWANWRDSIINYLPARYRKLKKFLTFPYMAIEMTTYTGNSLIIRPEGWRDKDATIVERGSAVLPNVRTMFNPKYYNSSDATSNFDDGERIGASIGMTNFPTMPVVNDGTLLHLASNANSLGWQRNSADWAQQRALGMAQGQYDIATGSINMAQALTGIGINADIFQTANTNNAQTAQALINAANAAVSGVGNALTPAGLAGSAVSGLAQASALAANATVGINANNEALGIRNAAASQTVAEQNRQAGLVRDTNKGLADWAAKGDYANTIAGIQAKVQDAELIAPSMAGTFGGDAFNIINQHSFLNVRWKMLDPGNMRRVGEYWLRYGYAVNSFMMMPASLKLMTKFTYWKTVETYITAADAPEGHKQIIRGILEKGVTVWSHPSYIGNTDIADNDVIGGFSY